MGLMDSLAKWTTGFQIDTTYVDDQLQMNPKEVWSWMVVPGYLLGIPTEQDIENHLQDIHQVLEQYPDEEFHLYTMTAPFDTRGWMTRVMEEQADINEKYGIQTAPIWESYVRDQAYAMEEREYKELRTYIGMKIGNRKRLVTVNIGEEGTFIQQGIQKARASWAERTGSVDRQPSKQEIDYWTTRAQEWRSSIGQSSLEAKPVSQDEMMLFLLHTQSLGTNCDTLDGVQTREWGSGVENDLAANIDNTNPRRLEFSRINPSLVEETERYEEAKRDYEADPSATMPPSVPEPVVKGTAIVLSFDLPDTVAHPWALRALNYGPSVDLSVRFKVLSPSTAEARANKVKTRAWQELVHQHEHGVEGGTARAQANYQAAAKRAQEQQTGSGSTQVEFTARLIVHGPDRNKVHAESEELRRYFRERLKINLVYQPGAQLSLWAETVPGQLARNSMHRHEADLLAFSLSLVFATHHMGYGFGLFCGTMNGPRGNRPFLFDPARAAMNGQAPAIVYNGALGGGKTVAMMYYLDLFRVRGYTTIVIDPKRDFLGLQALKGRGHVRVWDITKDGRPGVLDPFTLIPYQHDPDDPTRATPQLARDKWREETTGLVKDTILRTIGGDPNDDKSSILSDLISREMEEPSPSMKNLLRRFDAGELGRDYEITGNSAEQIASLRTQSLQLASLLRSAAETSTGAMIYGERDDNLNLMLKNVRTTIINVSGLELPPEGKEPVGVGQNIAVTLFSLIAAYAQRVLEDPKLTGPKALAIDEFQIIKGLPAVADLAVRVARMGRSLSETLLLGDQSSKSSTTDAFSNAIGARVVFRSNRDEAANVAKSLDRPDDKDLIQAVPSLGDAAGMALHTTPADPDSWWPKERGIGLVQLDATWNPEYLNSTDGGAFETNDIPGITRAAYRSYKLDAMGVLHDPMSNEDVSHEAVVADESDFKSGAEAAAEAGMRNSRPADTVSAPVRTSQNEDETTTDADDSSQHHAYTTTHTTAPDEEWF